MRAAEPRRRLYEAYCDTRYGLPQPGREPSAGLRAHFDVHLRRHLPDDRGAAILDLGCGFGRLLLYLRDLGYTNVRGVDVSPQQVDAARRLGLDNVTLGTALEHLGECREALDLVFALDVLEHQELPDLLELLDAIHAALRPGGRLVLRVPNADGPFAGLVRYGDLTHERSFTIASLRQVLLTCGFSRLSVRPVRPAVHGVRSAVRLALWHVLRLGLVACLAVETGSVRGHLVSMNLVAVAER